MSRDPGRSADADLPCDGHCRRPVLRAAGRHRLRKGTPQPRPGLLGAAPHRSSHGRQGAPRRNAPIHRRNGWSPAGWLPRLSGSSLWRYQRSLGARARTRTRPRQTYRAWVRRHSAVGIAARRSAGRAPQAARHYSADRACVGQADTAALAVHLMTNTAVTGATYDVDGGQQLVEA